MTADKDLVGRLRDFENEGITNSDRFHLRTEAADRIEQLEAEMQERKIRKAKMAQMEVENADIRAQLEATAKAYGAAVEDYNDLLAARAEPKSDHLSYEGSGRVATSVKDILNSRKVQQQVEAVRQLQNAPPDRAEPQPVAWRHEWDGDDSDLGIWLYVEEANERDGSLDRWQPLYAFAPPACALGGERGWSQEAYEAIRSKGYALGFQEAREAAVQRALSCEHATMGSAHHIAHAIQALEPKA